MDAHATDKTVSQPGMRMLIHEKIGFMLRQCPDVLFAFHEAQDFAGHSEWSNLGNENGMKSLMVIGARNTHDGIMAQSRFPHYWSFVRGIHRWPVDPPH